MCSLLDLILCSHCVNALQDDAMDDTYNIQTVANDYEVAVNDRFTLTSTVTKMPANIRAADVEVDFNQVRVSACRLGACPPPNTHAGAWHATQPAPVPAVPTAHVRGGALAQPLSGLLCDPTRRTDNMGVTRYRLVQLCEHTCVQLRTPMTIFMHCCAQADVHCTQRRGQGVQQYRGAGAPKNRHQQ